MQFICSRKSLHGLAGGKNLLSPVSQFAIEAVNLAFTYEGSTTAIDNINMRVPKGVGCALLGANGAGKSTLLLCLAGLLQVSQGQLQVCGEKLAPSKGRLPSLLGKVGIVFQDPDDQLFGITVADDVAIGPKALGLPRDDVQLRVAESLAEMGVTHLAACKPHLLSLGEKRRVAIAGVLATRPELVLFDEPTAFLDHAGISALVGVLHNLTTRGLTVLVATHDVDFVAEWADEVVVLRQGQMVCSGQRNLLGDAGLLSAAGLRPPLVSRIFTGMIPAGEQIPLTVAEARAWLANSRSR